MLKLWLRCPILSSRGDHTVADSYLTVIPRGTEFVVFSIDGSFAASVSIMGSDPKVRAGAVDVVRYRRTLFFFPLLCSGLFLNSMANISPGVCKTLNISSNYCNCCIGFFFFFINAAILCVYSRGRQMIIVPLL